MPARRTASRTACPESTGASVSLKAPRNALPIGVRAVETITASRTVFSRLLSEIQPTERIGDTHGLVAAFRLQRYADLHLHRAIRLLLRREDLGMRAHARARAQCRRKAHAVNPVVEPVPQSFRAHQSRQEVVDQREREVAVCDG